MVLVLNKREVASLIDIPAMIDAVEGALIQLSQGTALNPNRLRVFVPEKLAMMACMPAYIGGADGLFGARVVASSQRSVPPGEPRLLSSVVALANTSGQFLALMPASDLGPIRTCAASAVAIRHLARADASTIAIIGCGVQGRAELAGAAAARRLKQVYAYDIDEGVARRFCEEMTATLGLPIIMAASAEEAVARADIVTTATTSSEPVFECSAVRAGTHINAVGAHTPRTRELGSDLVTRARVFAETRTAILEEAGDVLIPLGEGRFTDAHVVGEIGEVAAGKISGRRTADDITVFKSTGIAVEDVIVAKLVYERAVSNGIGTTIEF